MSTLADTEQNPPVEGYEARVESQVKRPAAVRSDDLRRAIVHTANPIWFDCVCSALSGTVGGAGERIVGDVGHVPCTTNLNIPKSIGANEQQESKK
jgi:hypothetical protein